MERNIYDLEKSAKATAALIGNALDTAEDSLPLVSILGGEKNEKAQKIEGFNKELEAILKEINQVPEKPEMERFGIWQRITENLLFLNMRVMTFLYNDKHPENQD
ncbi:MAG: hypothetical protein PHR00_02825 [Patescibacteria group bacterium]|nr:hypothetical protein [Patescibacteria group bacterium]